MVGVTLLKLRLGCVSEDMMAHSAGSTGLCAKRFSFVPHVQSPSSERFYLIILSAPCAAIVENVCASCGRNAGIR